MDIRLIDFDRLEVYEAGALLLTMLAYPDESEETRSQVHTSLCMHALRTKCAMEPDWAIPRRSDNRRDLGKTRLNHLCLFKGHNSPPG
jgi:hypothetical protein